jgi:A/G-specific adenine glycosylase
MLQQTQVQRVLLKYPQFLRRFPTIRDLAAAQQRDVVIAWQGMGYNNRAVRLHRLAKIVVERYRGRLPRTVPELQALPGIGRYTAHALLASIYHLDVPVVDVNVQRLLSRLFWRMKTVADSRPTEEVWQMAGSLVPRGNSYNWNQALMDLGATICTSRNPRCGSCPVSALCASRSTMRAGGRRHHKNNGAPARTPDRIFRGRVIEVLRHKSRTYKSIACSIRPDFAARHKKWFDLLVAGLEEDGLIKRSGERISLA